MSRPRILVLLKGLNRGGAEKLVLDQTTWWNTQAFNYRVGYLDTRLDQLVPDFIAAGFPPIVAGDRSAITNILLGRAHALIRRAKPDLVHSHLPLPGIIARTSNSRAAIVYTEHSLPLSHHPVSRLLNSLTYSRNNAVICVSDAVREAVSDFSVPLTATIPNSISPPTIRRDAEAVRLEFGIPPGTKLIVHVGNVRPGKGHQILLDSVAHLADADIPLKVISVGAEQVPGMLRELREQARSRGLASLISFVGERADAVELINASDVVVNPSDVEGLPIALLEAMALAKPIAATAAGGVATLIEDGVRGHLVDTGAPLQLAAALEMLLRDPAGAREMGEAGQAYVAKHHSPEEAVRQVESIYKRVLSEKRPNQSDL